MPAQNTHICGYCYVVHGYRDTLPALVAFAKAHGSAYEEMPSRTSVKVTLSDPASLKNLPPLEGLREWRYHRSTTPHGPGVRVLPV